MKRYKLAEVTRHLARCAHGTKKAEVVIQDGILVNVHTGELLPHTDIAITHGRIALVGDATHTIGSETRVINASGQYIAPGFIDSHLHVESSMVTVTEYAKTVMPHGTTAIMMDPHEIANILGQEGVALMVQESLDLPLHVYTTMPSCVPAAEGFETTGAVLTLNEIGEALSKDEIIGLGEMMNYPAVVKADEKVHALLAATLEQDKIITGHYPAPKGNGKDLNAYISSGICCCHESTTMEEALAKMRLGMYVQMREGSAWCDLKAVSKAITNQQIDTRYACLVSDDMHPDTLLTKGHMDHLLRRAVEEGIPAVTAIQMATLNPAQCFRLDRELGSISPGKWADIVLLDSLESMNVTLTLINGEVIAKDGKMCHTLPTPYYPETAKKTMHFSSPISCHDLQIEAPSSCHDKCQIHAIGILESQAPTLHLKAELNCPHHVLSSDLAQDLLKFVVIDRHSGKQHIGKGFVKGFQLKKGAVAATIAHDAHNLSLLGTNDEDMALAANTLIACGGGQVVVCDGKVLALNPLPIAGLMSEEPIEKVAAAVSTIDQAWKMLGCPLSSPFMTMALLSLPVIPSLRLTNKGLIDVDKFQLIDLWNL